MAPAVHDRIVAAFNAANPGIKMELVRVVGTAMTARFEAERTQTGVEGGDAMITARAGTACSSSTSAGESASGSRGTSGERSPNFGSSPFWMASEITR